MNLRIYALSVSLAAVIGLLLAIGPTIKSALEYRSPESVAPPAELASADTFFVAKGKDKSDEEEWRSAVGPQLAALQPMPSSSKRESDERWHAMYDAAKAQHIQTVRSKAANNLIVYGTLCVLCIGLLAVHLRWARTLVEN
jgi:hypothetical protein